MPYVFALCMAKVKLLLIPVLLHFFEKDVGTIRLSSENGILYLNVFTL